MTKPFELKSIADYTKFSNLFLKMPPQDQLLVSRDMLRTDLFWLLVVALKRKDLLHPWLLARCKEVEKEPDGYLDLWARAHFKSSIITFGLTIQDILSSHGDNPDPKWNNVEPTFCIFSHTRPSAKQFLRQIKREFESNVALKTAFPDILWDNPEKDAPSWSEESGLIVKRKSNPKEATVEAHGLVDGMPIGKHYHVLILDDIVTLDGVRSPQMIEKTTQAWEMSIELGLPGSRYRIIGTRYHYSDTYKTIMDRKAAIPRIYPATVDGSADGEPVLLAKEVLEQKRRDQGMYVFSSQQLLQPVADASQGFKKDWLEFQTCSTWNNLNTYIFVDPANEKKKSSDYTAMIVVGLGADSNYYVLDIIRDRLSLTERADVLFMLHRKYKPLNVGYEKYGMQADIAHIKDLQRRVNYNFKVTELGGNLSKVDRIRKLIPLFEAHRIYLPITMMRTNIEGKTEDLVQVFMHEEYLNFPVSLHDDLLDALARITDSDMQLRWPKLIEKRDRYAGKPPKTQISAWGE